MVKKVTETASSQIERLGRSNECIGRVGGPTRAPLRTLRSITIRPINGSDENYQCIKNDVIHERSPSRIEVGNYYFSLDGAGQRTFH